MESRSLLSATRLTKQYPGVLALSGVDVSIRAGEVRALVGENGSGKSTLAKILYGTCVPDLGSVDFDGRPLPFGSPGKALASGVVAISQELTLAPELSVTENILMGRMPTRFGRVDWRSAHRRAAEALGEMELELDPRRPVGSLPVELQQEVEIVRALSQPAKLLILDEATSALSKFAADKLLSRVQSVSTDGCAVLLITHRMREIRQVAHSATVLRDGKLIATASIDDVTDDDLLRMMVGRDIHDIYGSRTTSIGAEVLQTRDLTSDEGSFEGVDLVVREGEVVGLAGLVGCGKSELGLALMGAHPSHGTLMVAGEQLTRRSVGRSIKAGLGYVPEDRKRQGLLPTRNVLENLSTPWKGLASRLGVIRPRVEADIAKDLVKTLNVKTTSLSSSIVALSGGNQQKTLFARWLPLHPKVLVLAEPTRGVDVGAKAAIYAVIQDLASRGVGVLLISSELPEVLGMSDRVLVMFEGRVVAELSREEATEEAVAEWAIGKVIA